MAKTIRKNSIDMLQYEKDFFAQGKKFPAGMDEAGRGPLAGPVVVACVVMPLDEDKLIEGINDSKKLSPKKREELFDKIISTALEYVVAVSDNDEIDKINILNATKKCMKNCIDGLTFGDIVLIDAVKLTETKIPTFSIIKGDASSYSIAAASIVAKVTRDRLMEKADNLYPQYGFKQHKGYGTKQHVMALKEHGPCPLHRATFIKNFFNEEQQSFLI